METNQIPASAEVERAVAAERERIARLAAEKMAGYHEACPCEEHGAHRGDWRPFSDLLR